MNTVFPSLRSVATERMYLCTCAQVRSCPQSPACLRDDLSAWSSNKILHHGHLVVVLSEKLVLHDGNVWYVDHSEDVSVMTGEVVL